MTSDGGSDAGPKLERLIGACMEAQFLRALVDLRIPETMGTDWSDAATLADRLHLDEAAVARLLRTAVAIGACSSDGHGRFALTADGTKLRADADGSVVARLTLLTAPEVLTAWSAFGRGATRGEVPFELAYGVPLWEHYETRPDAQAAFDAAMRETAHARATAFVAVAAPPMSAHYVDVGGGDGAFAEALVGLLPEATVTVVDRPRPSDHGSAFSERIVSVSTDYFDDIPKGADVYLLCRVLHNLDDARAIDALSVCRAAMRTGSKLFILESLLGPTPAEDGDAELEVRLTDLNMWALYGGRERTEDEFRCLLAKSGLRMAWRRPTAGPGEVIAALPN